MTGRLMFVPDTHAVVPNRLSKAMDDVLYDGRDTNISSDELYSALVAAAPQLTTPSVLRWEDRFLILGKKFIVISIAEVKDGFIYQFYKTKTLEEARRAAEKALGFPDGLIIDESN